MSIYKNLGQDDTTSFKTNLYEQIPVTGTILKGTYDGTFPSESNIKYFSKGTHIDVYDYPYASSSANFMFSMTAGQAPSFADTGFTDRHAISDVASKNNLYRQFAQQYVGYDVNQNVINFNVSGVLNPNNTWNVASEGDQFTNLVFINMSRVLMKDEIKKGSFQITIGTGSFSNPFQGDGDSVATHTFSDAYVNATNNQTYRTNSPMGDYAFLQKGTSTTVGENADYSRYGLIFYDAGLVALAVSGDIFGEELTSGSISSTTAFPANAAESPEQAAVSGTIDNIVNGVRAHIQNIQFNNTTELNSTVYFCRLNHSEFNYSSNPSYTSASQIVVKNNPSDPPVSYVTSVGLYSPDNQLLAVGKLSEPLKKTPANEFTLRLRLDY